MIQSAIGSLEIRLGWDARRWQTLLYGSSADSAALFFEMSQAFGGSFKDKSERLNWPARFGCLDERWRVFAAGLDEGRLGELLSGNLASDDSGLDPGYEAERAALRMLCALRVFKESELFKDDPDPRINSLRRIKLGKWREFAQVGAPGLREGTLLLSAAQNGSAREVARRMTESSLAMPARLGMAASMAFALALGIAAGWWGWQAGDAPGLAGIASMLGWFMGANSRLRGRMRGFMTWRACESMLCSLGCPASRDFRAVSNAGQSAAARQSGDDEAMLAALSAESARESFFDWRSLSSGCRKKINHERHRRAVASLAEKSNAFASDEKSRIDEHVGAQKAGPEKESSTRSQTRRL